MTTTTTKQSPVSVVKPVTNAQTEVQKPAKKEKPAKVVPGLKHHLEAAERLEDLLGSTMSEEAKAILGPFAKTVRNRMKKWAKVTVVYEET